MKRILFVLIAIITLAIQQPVMAQSHRATPRTTAVAQKDTAAIEVFSDTTGTASAIDDTIQQAYHAYQITVDPEDAEHAFGLLDNVMGGMFFVLIVSIIIFVIAPLLILFLIFYFIYKYRKQKLQLAEVAMKNGQPIPVNITSKAKRTDEDAWAKGVKKVALGAGLIACGWSLDFDLGIVAGYIFFFYGLGLMVIAKTTTKKKNTTSNLNDEEDTSLSNRDETPINN